MNGGGPQRTRHGEDRRADLLRHAEALFQERGYDATRMVDIAHAAGVAKGLVYWYFDSKETLFAEIIHDLRQRLRMLQADVTAGIDDPLAMMYVGTVASVLFVAENRRLYGLIQTVSTDDRFRPEASRAAEIHAGDTARVLAEGQRLGVVRNDDDALTIAIGNSGVVSQYAARAATPAEFDAAAHAAARYVVRAVAAREALAERVLAAYGTDRASPGRRGVAVPGA